MLIERSIECSEYYITYDESYKHDLKGKLFGLMAYPNLWVI